MNIDHITPSVLHVSASEDLNIEKDLISEQTKTIAELLQKDTDETKENTKNIEASDKQEKEKK
jgi:hypothetical protein